MTNLTSIESGYSLVLVVITSYHSKKNNVLEDVLFTVRLQYGTYGSIRIQCSLHLVDALLTLKEEVSKALTR
jgi:hypothetical protein